MKKITKDYFGDEVLLIGYSSEANGFSHMVHDQMTKEGIRVYPVNNQPNGSYDIQVYNSVGEIENVPDTACLLISKAGVPDAMKDLAEYGVKRVLVQSKSFISEESAKICLENNMELSVGCPFMSIGKGFHRFHGWLAGVR